MYFSYYGGQYFSFIVPLEPFLFSLCYYSRFSAFSKIIHMDSEILSTSVKMSSMLPCPCIHILYGVILQHFQSRATVHFSALESRLEFWFVWTVKCYYAGSEPKPHVALHMSTHFELPFQQPRLSCSVMANKVEQKWAILAEAIRDQSVPSQLESWLQWAQLRAKEPQGRTQLQLLAHRM